MGYNRNTDCRKDRLPREEIMVIFESEEIIIMFSGPLFFSVRLLWPIFR